MNKQATPSQAGATPVWFITGCSTGFGLELAKQAIERGDCTVVTARDLATAGKVRLAVRASSGKQPGDPVSAVKAIVEAVASGRPPHHLLLGSDAFEGAMAKIDELRQDFTASEAVARGADFPKAMA